MSPCRAGEHKLTYNVGKPEETFEWTRLSELAATELALDPSAPITLPPAGLQQAAGQQQLPPLPPPSPELRAAASQAVAAALSAALQTGLSPAALHALVDAAAQLQQQRQQQEQQGQQQQQQDAALPKPPLPLARLRVKYAPPCSRCHAGTFITSQEFGTAVICCWGDAAGATCSTRRLHSWTRRLRARVRRACCSWRPAPPSSRAQRPRPR